MIILEITYRCLLSDGGVRSLGMVQFRSELWRGGVGSTGKLIFPDRGKCRDMFEKIES